MNHPDNTSCTCTKDGYSPECPQAFYQGGKLLHTIGSEMRLKPRIYGPSPVPIQPGVHCPRPDDPVAAIDEQIRAIQPGVNPFDYEDVENDPIDQRPLNRARTHTPMPYTREQFANACDTDIRLNQSSTMDRFKPLTLNGVSMTRATIGGFDLDLASLANQAATVIPLPPVSLPVIFQDSDLNFMHHFFQGLEIQAGREFIVTVAELGRYSQHDKIKIGPYIKALIGTGYVEKDTELVIFVKRVISTTFELQEPHSGNPQDETYLVKSNFYGFQYIEGGMRCQEQDLRMWLHSAYTQYRNLWFNAFKSSGMPVFAIEGVQDRYDSTGPCRSSTAGWDHHRSGRKHPTRDSHPENKMKEIQSSDRPGPSHKEKRVVRRNNTFW